MSKDRTTKATNPFDSDSDTEKEVPRNSTQSSYGSSSYGSPFADNKARYRNDFRDSGGIQNQSTQELESYAVYKAEETTQKVNDCLRIAEDMREGASKTLVQLHQQGQQIERTHLTTVDIDQDLSRGEKLLGNLGGIFSRKWKPQKNRPIKGPMLARDEAFAKKGSHMEQRQRLGLTDGKTRSNPRNLPTEPASALEKVEVEKMKQDDALDDLSNILGELKEMAQDMGSEIDRYLSMLIIPIVHLIFSNFLLFQLPTNQQKFRVICLYTEMRQ
ncbi:soluble N-ethylmaleimide-sensitive factor adaptor protein 33 [Rhynchospora pubera]|uniref:Soluble N-ethylmaleimide-sensitive factor adaptor protein 33 n=1 Tax=Rhynchospora pubera TaxID=906938 RepID=A0AAV8FBT2_9POAL|nr:soluble N-ethylmaleimide-sensitive factor adaptor protein 33 [Rhynchospora pubera]